MKHLRIYASFQVSGQTTFEDFANANFEGLFYVFMGKKSTKWEFLHNCTKTLINIKVKKRWILVSKYSFSNLSCIFLSLMLLNLNIFFQFETNLQEQLKKPFCYQNWFWPFNVWKNYSSDLKHFSRSLEQFFLTAVQNNFVNKITFFFILDTNLWQRHGCSEGDSTKLDSTFYTCLIE